MGKFLTFIIVLDFNFFRSFLFLSLGERDRNEPKNKKESQPFLCRRKGAKRRLQGVSGSNVRTSYSGYNCRLLHSRPQTTIRYVSERSDIVQGVVFRCNGFHFSRLPHGRQVRFSNASIAPAIEILRFHYRFLGLQSVRKLNFYFFDGYFGFKLALKSYFEFSPRPKSKIFRGNSHTINHNNNFRSHPKTVI